MSSDRTDFELYKVATMQGIAWQTDKQTITLAGRFHFTSAAGYITVSPPLQTQHPTFRAGEKGR
jgi:hypothetical protein